MIYTEPNIDHLQSIVNYEIELDDYYHGKIKNVGLEINNKEWPQFNALYRPALGTLNIITGIPSHGKSSLMDAIIVNLAKNHKIKWALFSPENYPIYYHIQKLQELWTGFSYHSQNPLNKMSEELFNSSKREMENYINFINPPEELLTLSYILLLAKNCIQAGEINAIVIDPWNELISDKLDNQSETEYIGESLSTCRRFARTNNILFFILAHPAKMNKPHGAKEYDVPTLYSISGSAHWYGKADNGLTVFRHFNMEDRSKETVDVHVQKIRFKMHGCVGKVSMKYTAHNGQFTEIITDDAAAFLGSDDDNIGF